ncbi:hypothetical protein CLV46_0118 [Diaminobutyricimonas aerilata]|uniref:Phosphodiesterase n=1 Tax=Diaminobutyricimonas aerilata TaxID=1162967 RepID=A0A2M9CF65_9MICO|nr:hypothetical protein [Diaminobutyricimonas aerilata]PJJ70596.1 hypothetical protein CLV46_0118 [Diaminobutyricimonas aerilata]
MQPIVSTIAGHALRAVFRAVMLVRRPRPIHAHGVLLEGDLRWYPRRGSSGIPWIDVPPPGHVPVVARASRSAGLPDWAPDVIGLAFRFQSVEGAADVELASTGIGVPSRFMLMAHRSPSRARLGTLLPYRSEKGAVLLCARTLGPADLPAPLDDLAEALEREPWRLRLYYAFPTSRWRAFAELTLRRPPDADRDTGIRFDAVRNPLPGAGIYRWVRAFRQPSYELSQGHSSERVR